MKGPARRPSAYSRQLDELRNANLSNHWLAQRRLEDVAKLRRQLPPGGTVSQDYEFEEGAEDLDGQETIRRVKLSELFWVAIAREIAARHVARLLVRDHAPQGTRVEVIFGSGNAASA